MLVLLFFLVFILIVVIVVVVIIVVVIVVIVVFILIVVAAAATAIGVLVLVAVGEHRSHQAKDPFVVAVVLGVLLGGSFEGGRGGEGIVVVVDEIRLRHCHLLVEF